MKILQQNLALNQPGSVKIILQDGDDPWLLYNLIAKDDKIVMDTTRKVVSGDLSSKKKKTDVCRVKLKIEIKVVEVHYDESSSVIRIKGKNTVANEFVAVGAFHTLEIEKNKEFDLFKKLWKSDAIEKLRECSESRSGADVAVIIFQPSGSAELSLVADKVTTHCAKIESSSRANNKTSSNKFFEGVFQAFVKHVDFNNVRCVMLGSSSSVKEEFRAYLFQEAHKQKLTSIQDNKARFVIVNTGKKNNLTEIFDDKEVMRLITDTKSVLETKAFKEFTDLLLTDADRACYGPKSVENANEMLAIDTLLITDDLLNGKEIAVREKYRELVKSVKNTGGKVCVYSSFHVSTEKLAQLTGIASILRFPLPDI